VLSALDKRLRGVETSASPTRRLEASQKTDSAIEEVSLDPSHTVSSNTSTLGRASHEPSLPWRMLATSDTATSPNRLSRLGSLADEELNLRVSSNKVPYDILNEFPLLDQVDVINAARAFAFEAPFAFIHWPSLKQDLHTLLEHKYAASASQLACILMVRSAPPDCLLTLRSAQSCLSSTSPLGPRFSNMCHVVTNPAYSSLRH
jgi:hypothetical protein